MILEISDQIIPLNTNPPSLEAAESNNSVFWNNDYLQGNNSKKVIKNSLRLSSTFSALKSTRWDNGLF